MQIWTFLHILAMFAAVTVVVGAILWVVWAIRARDIASLRAYFRIAPMADKAGVALFIAGIAFGLIAAVVIGWDLLVLWLVVAYILVVVTVVLGVAGDPYLKQLEAALPEAGDESISPELEALLRSPLPVVIAALSILAVAAIIAMMVFKPMSL